MSKLTLVSTLLFQLVFIAFTSDFKVNPDTHFFVDPYNRTRLFHGVNIVYKLPPHYPPVLNTFDTNLSLSEEDFALLHSWGMNVIRLFMSWEGTETIRGDYNATYLETIMSLVKKAAKYNITILLDAHQDAVSRKFCGEGFPDWAVNRTDFPAPLPVNISFDSAGHANLTDCAQRSFGDYYQTTDSMNAFRSFFNDVDGIAESFTDFWREVAKFFKDEPNIIGYDLINEPSTFDFSYQDIDKDYLQPLYQRIHNKIRQVDNDTVIFFAPDSAGPYTFTQTPGGPEYNDRQVFSYHVYCEPCNDPQEPRNPNDCQQQNADSFAFNYNFSQSFGIGAFVTEFGSINGSQRGLSEITIVTSLADSYLHSWIYWQYKGYNDFTSGCTPSSVQGFFNDDGTLRAAKAKIVARSYVYATCGHPQNMTFDVSTGNFTFVYQASNQCQGSSTEIYLSEDYYYPNGFTQSFQNCSGCEVSLIQAFKKNYYQIVLPQDFEEGTTVTLNISPATSYYKTLLDYIQV